MKPWEFERLQVHEFNALLNGYQWRRERQEEIAAYFVSGLMNISGRTLKQRITPKDLLKPLRQPVKRNKREDAQYLKEIFNL